MDCPQYIPPVRMKDEEERETGNAVSLLSGWSYACFLMAILTIYLYFYMRDSGVFYFVLVPLVIVVIWGVVKYMIGKKGLKQMEAGVKNEKTGSSASGQSARMLLQMALHRLNLHYEFDPDQNFVVRYQGEYFRIIANDDDPYLGIQDSCWYSVPLDDIDSLSLLYKAVNECNMHRYHAARMVYTYDKAENELDLHTLCNILWVSQIPCPEAYLKDSFERMLGVHHLFFRRMEELRREEFGKQNS